MKKITAPQGQWLTQANLQEGEARIFVRTVSGFGDLDALFTFWSDEQKEQWEKEHITEEE